MAHDLNSHILHFRIINPIEYKDTVLSLLVQLNPHMDTSNIQDRFLRMIDLHNYTCFALFQKDILIGISTGWTSVRVYCGKQLELDNVIIDETIQSKGYGKYFMDCIEDWAIKNDYESIGLNSYVTNSRSHKFYYNQGYKVLGFHFEKNFSDE